MSKIAHGIGWCYRLEAPLDRLSQGRYGTRLVVLDDVLEFGKRLLHRIEFRRVGRQEPIRQTALGERLAGQLGPVDGMAVHDQDGVDAERREDASAQILDQPLGIQRPWIGLRQEDARGRQAGHGIQGDPGRGGAEIIGALAAG